MHNFHAFIICQLSITLQGGGILKAMKVLLTPLITNPNSDASYFLTRNLASLFAQANYACAISAPKENHFHHGSLYPCTPISKPLFLHTTSQRSYEEHLYSLGALQENTLKKDVDHLLSVCDEYKPDVIVTIDRIAALIVSKIKHIPCYAFVNHAIYTYTSFDSRTLQGVNATLSSYHLEQVFNLKSLYISCAKRFAFGPIETQPLADDWDIVRIGVSSIYPRQKENPQGVYIHFQDIDLSQRKLQKIVREAFLGSKENIIAHIKGTHSSKEENITFSSSPKEVAIENVKVCIHDGNAYLFNQCLALGIPQLIIANHGYLRNHEGLISQRNRFGLCLYEDEFDMASLYEVYRRLCADSVYKRNAMIMQANTLQYGDLTKILYYL